MSRPVTAEEADLDAEPARACGSGPCERQGTGMPDEDDLRTVHDILESAFADHFNSHEETFDEFVFRLREDPGHRWDHWWIAELTDGDDPGAGRRAGRGRVARGRGDRRTAATWSTSGCCRTPAAAAWRSHCCAR